MQYQKIVIAGGNGYLGAVLSEYYSSIAEQVIILSRKPRTAENNVRTVLWDGRTEGKWTQALEGADLLINLCGKNVNCRYTKENREEIIRSRVVPTLLLGKVVAGLLAPPALWINVTSATIYRHAEDHYQDEETGEIGYGFSIDVCKKWENAFFSTPTPATRKVALRLGIVLGSRDGVFPRLHNLVKCGMGGKQGNGHQYISWIHEQDFAKCTHWLCEQKQTESIINCTAPGAIQNAAFMKLLRKATGIPLGLPAPGWLLAIGAAVIGTEPELILKSRWVHPGRLLSAGFTFSFPEAAHAINDILSVKV